MTSRHFADNDGWDEWGDWNDNGNNNNNNIVQQPAQVKTSVNNNELPNISNFNYNFTTQQQQQQQQYHQHPTNQFNMFQTAAASGLSAINNNQNLQIEQQQQQQVSNPNPPMFHAMPPAKAPLFFDTSVSDSKNSFLVPPMPAPKQPVFEKVGAKKTVAEPVRPPSIPPPTMSPFDYQRPPSVGQPASELFDMNRVFDINRPKSNELPPQMVDPMSFNQAQAAQVLDTNRPSLTVGADSMQQQQFAGVQQQQQQHNDSLPPPPPAAIFERENQEQDFESFQISTNKNSPPPPPPASNTENLKHPVAQTFDYQAWQQPFVHPPKTSTPNPPAFNMEMPSPIPPVIHQHQPVNQRDILPGAEMTPNVENVSQPPQVKQEKRKMKYPENKFMMAPVRAPSENKENIETAQNMEVFPENRERLEDESVPLNTDRHSYMVTGQLSNDPNPQPVASSSQPENVRNNASENTQQEFLPPPGLSRMVVGQTESNQEHLNAPPPGLNRLVTGIEVATNDYNNLRQADGEVSQTPIVPKSTASYLQHMQDVQQQNAHHDSNQNFAMTDRNSYLVPGESDAVQQQPLSQRGVIPGVESDSSLTNIVTPMQQMKINVNEELENRNIDERNVNVDGENVCDNVERDKNIEGADKIRNPSKKHPVLYSTEESERNEETTMKTSRKPTDYDSNDSDSERERERERDRGDYKKSRDPKRSTRDRQDRDDESYYRGKRRDNDRERGNSSRYGGRGDRRRRDDYDSDGSKYDTEQSRREKDRGKSRNSDDDDSRDRLDSSRRSKYRGRDDKDLDRTRDRDRDRNRDRNATRTDKDRYRNKDRRDRDRDRYDRDRRSYYGSDRERGRGSRRYDYESSDREYSRRSKDRDYRDDKKPAADYYPTPSYGYGADYNSQYAYYAKHQQYFEHLRKTNPQAYYDWYKSYYASLQLQQQMGPKVAGEESMSGYSSGKEGYGSQMGGHFQRGGGLPGPLNNSSLIDQSNYPSIASEYELINKQIEAMNRSYHGSMSIGQSSIAGDYVDNLARKTPLQTETNEEIEKRSTPHKFMSLHSLITLSNGIITSVDANDHIYTVKMENIVINDHSRKLLQFYPGPLVRGTTHKKTIIEFCEEQLRVDSHNSMFSVLSHTIDPHLKQMNKASYVLLWNYLILLLRQNGNFTEADISELLIKNSEEFENLSEDRSDRQILSKNPSIDNTDISSDEQIVSQTVSTKSTGQEVSAYSEKTILHKFRDFLLYGNIKDALDFATDNNLWGHALFLASKVDQRQHANVMLKFANKLPYNDPLQTLYQIMSGRMPACVTNLDDKWGDWRPHLAMIISNCIDKPELVKRSIVALGDLLQNRGDLFGSQFCYLLVDPQFGKYNEQESKMVLLGASHHNAFKKFASNESIIMTEVYEYARSLHQNEEHYFIPELQKYKFLLANNMLDHGMQLKCLLYMEQISLRIIQQPDAFEFGFIQNIFNLADRLKFYDPVMEKSYEDNYNNNVLNTIEDPNWLQQLKVVLHNASGRIQYEPAPSMMMPQQVYPEEYSQTQQEYNQQQQQQMPEYNLQQAQEAVDEQYQPEPTPMYSTQDVVSNQAMSDNYGMQNYDQSNFFVPTYNQNAPDMTTSQPNQYAFQESPQKTLPESQMQQPEITQQQTYEYSWNQPTPNITLGNAMSSKAGFNSQNSTDETNSQQKEKSNNVSDEKKMSDQSKKTSQKDAKGDNAKSGWFGGIFSKLSLKAPNQMKLPDDKNPTIVWDDKNKKWINKDGGENEDESFKPPPKMNENMGKPAQPTFQQPQPSPVHLQQQQQQQQQIASPPNEMPVIANAGPSATPATAAASVPTMPSGPPSQNMFKMQKRTLKKSYVDILGNSGNTTTAKPAPAPMMPAMETNFFNPQQSQGMPQFYNPNDFQ